MPRDDQPKPILRLLGQMRGDLEVFDSRPDREGVVRELGRARILTDDGGFCDVFVPHALVGDVPRSGPVPVSWDVEVAVFREKLMTGSGEERRPWLDSNGQEAFKSVLSLTLFKVVQAEEVPAATPIAAGRKAG